MVILASFKGDFMKLKIFGMVFWKEKPGEDLGVLGSGEYPHRGPPCRSYLKAG